MADTLKVDLVKLISKMEGLEKDRKTGLIRLLEDPETIIPHDPRQLSEFFTLLICDGNPDLLMTKTNESLLSKFSDKHLRHTGDTISPSQTRRK